MPRILIIAPAWIGDAVLSQPMLSLIKHRSPDTTIDVIAPAWVMPVYERMMEVSRVTKNPFSHGEFRLWARRAFGKELADAGYTHAYVLPNSFKSALIPWFANIKTITAYSGESRGWLLTDCRPLDKRHLPTMAERFAWLAGPATQSLPIAKLSEPKLPVDKAVRDKTIAKFKLDAATSILALCPGAEYGPAKRWPATHFAKLAKTYLEKGKQVWLFGGKGDLSIATEINRLTLYQCVNLAGLTTLDEAIDMISLADHVVTNDSGLMHIACAVGAPVTALYGSSSPAFTPPLSKKARILSIKIACSPCFQRQCPLGHFRCMNDLSVGMVANAMNTPTAAATNIESTPQLVT